MKLLVQLIIVAALAVPALQGQTQDSSGNGMLKGNYRFRQVALANFTSSGDFTEASGVFGTITFDGNGRYAATGTRVDNRIASGQPQVLNVTGTYTIGANGFGDMTNPLAPSDGSNAIFGAVAQSVFVGSSTEGDINDIFIAIPAGSAPTNATFTGPYWLGLLDFSGATSAAIKNALFEITPNGQGGFGTITVSGQAANQSAASIRQAVAGATYSFPSDGSISLNVPLPSGVSSANALVTGAKTMFQSADGNFILGWTPGGYDILFGVKALTATGANNIYQGLYYFAALEEAPRSGNPCGNVDSFYGSVVADGAGNEIVHERLVSALCAPIDFEGNDPTPVSADGSATDFFGYRYVFGAGGKAFVRIGASRVFSLTAGLRSSDFSGPGVFLNPAGITNSASYAPFTMSLAPGEMVSLFGSGLSRATQSATGGQALPTTLDGVQVLVNGKPAPLFFVSAGQINLVLPLGLNASGSSLASIQVSNNGALSNVVTLFTGGTAPGIFSQTQNGRGYAAALHALSGAPVTPANPAQPGEFLAIFLTGLGTVTPAVGDGVLAPISPLAFADVFTSRNLAVFFDDYTHQVFPQAAVSFAGLAPGLAGLYQLNVEVPPGIGPGDVHIEIVTDSADVNHILVPVGSSSGSALETSSGSLRESQPGFLRLPRSPALRHRVISVTQEREN